MNFNDLLTRIRPIETHPLFDAAWDDSKERLQLLLNGGDDLYEESSGMTALYAAIENNSLQAFHFLLDYGIDPNRLIGSYLPLTIAIDKEITASTGGGVWPYGLIDNDGLRPNPIFSQTLLLHGANPELKDSRGTPIEYARMRHHYSFLELVSQSKSTNTCGQVPPPNGP
jgi:ankyrin repeat protein